MISHVHGLEELILLKYPYYQKRSVDSMQFLFKFPWHFSQKQNFFFKFGWNHTRPQITKVTPNKKTGGLTLSDFNLYIYIFFFLSIRGRFFLNFIYLFIFGCVWVFVSVRGLSLVVASGGQSSSQCAGLSPSWPLPLRSTGSRRAGSVVVAHGPSRSAARGIFPDQGSNRVPCIGRQVLNHCATREALISIYI